MRKQKLYKAILTCYNQVVDLLGDNSIVIKLKQKIII